MSKKTKTTKAKKVRTTRMKWPLAVDELFKGSSTSAPLADGLRVLEERGCRDIKIVDGDDYDYLARVPLEWPDLTRAHGPSGGRVAKLKLGGRKFAINCTACIQWVGMR